MVTVWCPLYAYILPHSLHRRRIWHVDERGYVATPVDFSGTLSYVNFLNHSDQARTFSNYHCENIFVFVPFPPLCSQCGCRGKGWICMTGATPISPTTPPPPVLFQACDLLYIDLPTFCPESSCHDGYFFSFYTFYFA